MEKIGRVLWISPSLYVSMSMKNKCMVMLTFIAVVVQIDEVGLEFAGERRDINCVPMVLTGDMAASSSQVQRRDVMCTIAIFELDRLRACSQREQLMTQADTKDGDLAGLHQLAQMVDCLLAMRRITRTVGNEYTIKVVGNLVDRVVEWEAGNAGATADQTAEDVLLDTAIDHSHMAGRIGSTDVKGRLCANPAYQVDLFRIHERRVLILIVLLSNCYSGQGRTLLSQICDYSSCINSGNGWDALSGTPVAQTLHSGPVTVMLCCICNDHTDSLYMWRLEVFQQPMLVTDTRRDAVVADERLCEDEDLATVGRVGEGFRVANERCCEDCFAGDVGLRTERLAVKDGPISDREGCSILVDRRYSWASGIIMLSWCVW